MSGLLRLGIGTHDVAGHAPDLGTRCGWCARTVRSPRSADGPLRRRPVDPHLGQERCHRGRCVRSHDVERSRRGLVGAARFAPPLRSQSSGSRGMGRAPNAASPCRWCRRRVSWCDGFPAGCRASPTRRVGSTPVHGEPTRTDVPCEPAIHLGHQRHRRSSIHFHEVATPARCARSRGSCADVGFDLGHGKRSHASSH